ncbi:pilus assembly protein TadG-related protein [Actinomadura sp. 3N407]
MLLAVGALMVTSLVYFQGLKLRAGREAGNVAEEAARAGAGQLNRAQVYRTGVKSIDPEAAVRQARAYLAGAGQRGTVTTVGARRVRVTVTISRPAPMLSLIGVETVTATRTATADLVTGVDSGDGQ